MKNYAMAALEVNQRTGVEACHARGTKDGTCGSQERKTPPAIEALTPHQQWTEMTATAFCLPQA